MCLASSLSAFEPLCCSGAPSTVQEREETAFAECAGYLILVIFKVLLCERATCGKLLETLVKEEQSREGMQTNKKLVRRGRKNLLVFKSRPSVSQAARRVAQNLSLVIYFPLKTQVHQLNSSAVKYRHTKPADNTGRGDGAWNTPTKTDTLNSTRVTSPDSTLLNNSSVTGEGQSLYIDNRSFTPPVFFSTQYSLLNK